MSLLRTALAFLRRDLLVTTSYRLNFVLGLLAVAASLLFLSFIADFVGPMVDGRLGEYGGDYFAFSFASFSMERMLAGLFRSFSTFFVMFRVFLK